MRFHAKGSAKCTRRHVNGSVSMQFAARGRKGRDKFRPSMPGGWVGEDEDGGLLCPAATERRDGASQFTKWHCRPCMPRGPAGWPSVCALACGHAHMPRCPTGKHSLPLRTRTCSGMGTGTGTRMHTHTRQAMHVAPGLLHVCVTPPRRHSGPRCPTHRGRACR